jgi:hypothetical protein
MPVVNRWSRLSDQTCSPRAASAGKRSAGSDRKNACSWFLVAVSRTPAAPVSVRPTGGPAVTGPGWGSGGGRRGGRDQASARR